MKLDGKHVVVTGASRGIGARLVSKFAAAGSKVSLVARNADQLSEVADTVDGRTFPTDLADPVQVDALVDRIEDEAGPIDVLINNAGLLVTEWLADLKPEEIRAVTRVNLEAPMVLTNRLLPRMVKREGGHLVYLSSLAGVSGFPSLSVYGATKAGLLNFVSSLDYELKGTAVGATVVAPGPVDTAMLGQLNNEDHLAPVLRRLRKIQMLPTKDPDWLAQATIDAVVANRRFVRTPRRLASNFWLHGAPNRLTRLVLSGVPTSPHR